MAYIEFETAMLRIRCLLPEAKKPSKLDVMKLAHLAAMHGYTVDDYDRMYPKDQPSADAH